jgi:WD40 repeat protein
MSAGRVCLLLVVSLMLAPNRAVRGEPAPATDPKTPKPDKPVRTDRYGDPLPPGAIARLGTLRWRQDAAISALAYSRDGKTLASGDMEGSIVLWEARSGKRLRKFKKAGRVIKALQFTRDGRLLALLLNKVAVKPADLNLYLWTPSLWDVLRNKQLGRFYGHPGGILPPPAAIALGGKTVASMSWKICLWDPAREKAALRLESKKMSTNALAFSPGGKVLASGPGVSYTDTVRTHRIRLWDVATGEVIRQFTRHRESVTGLAFSPDGKILASSRSDRTVRLWDPASGKEIRRFPADREEATALTFTPDGKTLALGIGGKVYLREVATGKYLPQPPGHDGTVYAVAFSPDGKTLASGGTTTTRLWNLGTTRQLYQRKGLHDDGSTLAFSPDGQTLAAGFDEARVVLWEASTGKVRRWFHDSKQGHWSVAFANGGKFLAAGNHRSEMVSLWDPATGRELRRLEMGTQYVKSLCSSPDGSALTAGDGGGTVRLWNPVTGRHFRRLARDQDVDNEVRVFSVAFSPDGKLLATGLGTQKVLLWEVLTGKEIMRLEQPPPKDVRDAGFFIAYSPDGQIIASGGDDKYVYLWDIATGKKLGRLAGHRAPIYALAFSPDGNTLASGSEDTTILVWGVTGFRRQAQRRALHLGEAELQRLWAALADDDAGKAYASIWRLTGASSSVGFLGRRLRPAPWPDPKRIPLLLADLDNKRFAVRRQAERELSNLAEQAEPALRKALKNPRLSLEARQRVERLVRNIEVKKLAPAPQELQALRSLAVLEGIGSPEACRLLGKLKRGAPEARLTQEAKATLKRLARRIAAQP